MRLDALLWSFQGRISRGEFWLGILLTGFWAALLEGVLRALAAVAVSQTATRDVAVALIGLAIIIAVVATAAIFAIYAKRFHDVGRSGWWSLIVLVPVANIWA